MPFASVNIICFLFVPFIDLKGKVIESIIKFTEHTRIMPMIDIFRKITEKKFKPKHWIQNERAKDKPRKVYIKMVTLMPYSYLSAPRCGLIDKTIEPKVLKTSFKTINFNFIYSFRRFFFALSHRPKNNTYEATFLHMCGKINNRERNKKKTVEFCVALVSMLCWMFHLSNMSSALLCYVVIVTILCPLWRCI